MFVVAWTPAATDDLANICLNHPDRWSDIDAAENDTDYKLRKNPAISAKQLRKACFAPSPRPWRFTFP
jgi:hypothetical protein